MAFEVGNRAFCTREEAERHAISLVQETTVEETLLNIVLRNVILSSGFDMSTKPQRCVDEILKIFNVTQKNI